MTFNNLNLAPQILKAITEAGYVSPTEIQLKAIPQILSGCDIRASAQTGTGKTAAFLWPALNRLITPSKNAGKGARILILAPTRELAMQIAAQADKYSIYMSRTKTVCIGGGVPYHAQLRNLSRPYDILVATPGRLIDLMERRKVDFSRLEMFVIDEADRMLDMGFVESVEQIVAATPASRQTLLFSATLQGSILKLSKRLLNNPQDIVVHAEQTQHASIKQYLHYVDNLQHKNRLLHHILSTKGVDLSIVFTSTKRHAAQLVGELHDKGLQAAALHGDMNQRQRTKTIMQMKKGMIKILIATDVAARGIDVQAITHVINFDLPNCSEDYVHRIGRTGRAGSSGIALSFAAAHDVPLIKKIETFTGQKIDVLEIAGFEARTKQRKHPRPFKRKQHPHKKTASNKRR